MLTGRKFTNGEICALFKGVRGNKEPTTLAVNWILSELQILPGKVPEENLDTLRSKVSSFHGNYVRRFRDSRSDQVKFVKNHESWLHEEFEVKLPLLVEASSTPSTSASATKPGRPPLPFELKSERAKLVEAKRLSDEFKGQSTSAVVAAAALSARSEGKRDLATVLRESIRSPSRPSKMRKRLFAPTEPGIGRYTPQEALALILDLSLSKAQYELLRQGALKKNADIYPPYRKVMQVKKECKPKEDAMTYSDTVASVELQALLDHTTDRILELNEEVICQYAESGRKKAVHATLICSWDFDGSSGQSQYKQKFADDPKNSDESVFATTIIPMRLVTEDHTILWSNHTPQSVRFCRPVKLEFVKETANHILQEKAAMDADIFSLKVFDKLVSRFKLTVEYSTSMTLIDGKVLNIITGTPSMQRCPICKASPKEFNNLSNIDTELFDPQCGTLKYGVSPLHAWIRFMECLLKISYRLDVRKWKVGKGPISDRKRIVQNLIWEGLGLKVDRPKPGGAGSTTDGNTARRFFKDIANVCELIGIDLEIGKRFHAILIALSCQLPIDPVLFGEFCRITAEMYVSTYPWYPMTPSVRKVLIHGCAIIINSVLPVGMMGEEASEGQNKVYKKFRLYHARKHSRVVNLQDVFNRVMESSDPIISSVSLDQRIRKQKHAPLPEEVRNLLAVPYRSGL